MLTENQRLLGLVEGFSPSVSVDSAHTPPSSWYTDPEIAELERASVFRRHWLAICCLDQLLEPGSYVSGDLAGEPYVVLRDDEGQLRAFYNVCQHHGACIMEGSGRAESLTCPYHGWTYGLDGCLNKAPQVGAIKDFRRSEFGLKPIKVRAWGPLVFIYLGEGEPPDLDEQLKPLDMRLSEFGGALVHRHRKTYDLDCNWKVFADNYLDGGYHVDSIHPALASELDTGAYQVETFDTFSIQSCPSSADADGRLGGGALYAYVHPNLMLNRYGPVLDVNIVLPLGHDRCQVIFDYLFEDVPEVDDAFVEDCIAQSHQVQLEDVAICASVQRGLHSSAYDKGRYAPGLEHAMHRFHRLLYGDYMAGLGKP